MGQSYPISLYPIITHSEVSCCYIPSPDPEVSWIWDLQEDPLLVKDKKLLLFLTRVPFFTAEICCTNQPNHYCNITDR